MISYRSLVVLPAVLLLSTPLHGSAAGGAGPAAPAGQAMPADCPLHAEHMAAAAAAKASPAPGDPALAARGDQAMGFSQSAATHHFLLQAAGGEIRVEADSAQDTKTRDHIRDHLVQVARSFAAGDFHTPMAVHNQIPPGVPALERLRTAVNYSYSDTDRGGRVELQTTDAEALKAIHEFLSFQIREHRTGDPLTAPGN